MTTELRPRARSTHRHLCADRVVPQEPFEMFDGALEPVLQRHPRRPVEHFLGLGDLGPTLLWIVLRQRTMRDLGAWAGVIEHHWRKLEHGNFAGVPHARVCATGARSHRLTL